MPWTKKDVDRFKKGLTDKQKEKWVAVANENLDQCLKSGGSKESCEAQAIKIANSSVINNKKYIDMQKYNNVHTTYSIRREYHQGREHLVVPVVMMVEGVHCGSHGPLLHTTKELGKYPDVWNGMPVLVGHPKDENNNDIPANSPEVVDREVIGRVYNTHVSDSKLKGEVWLDYEKTNLVSPIALRYVEDKKPLDVSIGVFTDEESTSGQWNGEQYEAIARNHRPDHLALLPGGKGACSWEDGCGIRANEEGGNNLETVNYELVVNAVSFSGTESTNWSAPSLEDFDVENSKWEDLSKSEKSKVASHFLIGSSSADSFSDLHYPVVNPKTGKLNENALRAVISGRGAALKGVPDDTKSAARRRAYKLLNKEFDADLKIPNDLSKNNNEGGNMSRKRNDKVGKVEQIIANNEKFTEDDKEWLNNLEEEQLDKIMPEDKSGEPCCPDKVEELINNELTNFSEDDREWLLEQDKETIEKMFPKKPAEKGPQANDKGSGDEGDKGDKGDKKAEVTPEVLAEAFKSYAKKPEDFLGLLPEEMKETFQSGLKLHREKKASMIKEIQNNTENFTEDELKNMDNDMLEKIHKSVVPEGNYAALGSRGIQGNEENEEEPLVFGIEDK